MDQIFATQKISKYTDINCYEITTTVVTKDDNHIYRTLLRSEPSNEVLDGIKSDCISDVLDLLD